MKLRLALLLALPLSFAGCRLVDLGAITAFGCNADGACAEGLTCCSDKTCRLDCSGSTGSGGGGGVTGGGGGTGGGSTGGGSATGGGNGVDAGVHCDAKSCPTGCCDGETCVTSVTSAQCGRAGVACQACSNGAACIDGACESCLQTCQAGCCLGNTCSARTVNSCGLIGAVCNACGQEADTCTNDGQCACGSGAPCGYGQRCQQGQCTCDATSCPDGCCSSTGQCVLPNRQNGSQCGVGGVMCAGCDVPPDATCSSSTQRTAFRAPGVCSLGVCQYASVTMDCAFGCNNGSCENDVCQGCLVPPQSVCVGGVRRSYQSPGSCGSNGCSYTQVDTTCPFGCNAGACNPDPCAGVACDQPSAPRCSGAIRITSSTPGTCAAGMCSYTEVQTTCQFGCDAATGNCKGDLCANVTCDAPPPATCMGSTRRSYISPGACNAGSCAYTPQDTVCANGCNAGACLGDPCAGVSCTMPPAPICLNGSTRRTYASSGTCNLGGCNYPPTDQTCPYGCVNGSCMADPCSGISCTTPPGPTCQGNLRRTYGATGTCSGAMCSYPPTDTACNSPPATACVGANTLRTYGSSGTCQSGACVYSPTDTTCANGCSNGACNADPCAGVSCTSAPPAVCTGSNTRRVYGSPGTCGAGMCSYPTQDQTCNSPPAASCIGSTARTWSANGTCSGGACNYTSTDTACANGCTNGACNGDPCAGVSCTTPPAATCASSTTRRTFAASGTCSAGNCSYAPTDTNCNTPPPNFCVTGTTLRSYTAQGTCTSGACGYATNDTTCPFACANGACNPDPCAGISCTTTPAADCANSTTRRVYSSPGTCAGGNCSYPSTQTVCNAPPAPTCNGANTVRTWSGTGTCSGGTCSYAPIDTACNAPPAPSCTGGVARTWTNPGTCNDGQGTCSYTPVDTACGFGCSGSVCAGDPCAGISCNSPPASTCDDAWTLRVYNSGGSCSGGMCNYSSGTQYCANGCANGACQPCNSITCGAGCCSSGMCYLHTDWCRGTGGGTCGNGCTGGRWCDNGTCTCGPIAVQGDTSVEALPICP